MRSGVRTRPLRYAARSCCRSAMRPCTSLPPSVSRTHRRSGYCSIFMVREIMSTLPFPAFSISNCWCSARYSSWEENTSVKPQIPVWG